MGSGERAIWDSKPVVGRLCELLKSKVELASSQQQGDKSLLLFVYEVTMKYNVLGY